jgi:hypothetical protein
MNRPEFEVMHFDKDIIMASGECTEKQQECGVFTCNAECEAFCKSECGTVYG